MARAPFDWDGMEHWTGGDLLDTLLLISSQDEADSFLSAYAEVCDDDDHALYNLRYMAQIIATDDDSDTAEADAKLLAGLFGFEMPKNNETISPRQWFAQSSLGVKATA
jgi:hypothetical protein